MSIGQTSKIDTELHIMSNVHQGLGELSDVLANLTFADWPFQIRVGHVVDSLEDVRRIRRDSGHFGWKKEDHGDLWSFTLNLAGDNPGTRQVMLVLYVYKSAEGTNCQKVQTGTRHVEAVEAHDEPVFEWICGPSVADEIK